MKPTLKAPGTKRLKLNHDKPLLSFAFNFKLRRCFTAEDAALWEDDPHEYIRKGYDIIEVGPDCLLIVYPRVPPLTVCS
jgi:hypothetical protein